jgi:excisionase family DNA binding protein
LGATLSRPLLTARQVADLLGVSSETILRWTRRGELPAIRLPGGALRYRADALEQWLGEHATAGDATRGVSPPQDATRLPVVSSIVTARDSTNEEDH